MHNFKVFNNDFSFKSFTAGYKLVFYGSTSIKKFEIPDIPVNYLNILDLKDIVEGMFQSNMLVYVVGGVTKIFQTQMIADNNKNKIVFTRTDMSKSLVQCTLWGQLAIYFYD
ncbi:unnamed protein product [Vicia faba]|uniref:Uncharacterized protein n=1 Tax=Vicia faba TaxID=3906 RepID=A0AAV1ASY1_VICFA|nr:unnamed protein product [Vicia faba]